MSMDDVKEKAEEARKVLGQLTTEAKKAQSEAQAKLKGLDTEVAHVLTGAQVAVRSINDDREVVVEKLGQFAEVFEDKPSPKGHNDDQGTTPTAVIVTPAPDELSPRERELKEENDRLREQATAKTTIVVKEDKSSTKRKLVISALVLAFIAFLITLVFTSHVYQDVLGWAQGDAKWGDNGFVRSQFIVMPAVIVGYWVWIVVETRRSRKEK